MIKLSFLGLSLIGDGRITSLSTVVEQREFLWTEEQEPISKSHFFSSSSSMTAIQFKVQVHLAAYKKSSFEKGEWSGSERGRGVKNEQEGGGFGVMRKGVAKEMVS